MEPKRIGQFEALRGVLALWVLLAQCVLVAGYDVFDLPWPLRFIGLSYSPVEVFMILSGFVIFFLIESRQERYPLYLLRRFLRIYPVFIVCLLLAYYQIDQIQVFLRQLPWTSYGLRTLEQVTQDSIVYRDAHFFAHLTLLHGLVPNRVMTSSDFALLSPAWSLSLEWQFYLLAPLLFLLVKTRAGFLLLLAALLAMEAIELNRIAFLGTQAKFFAVGAVSYLLWKHKGEWFRQQRWMASRVLFYGAPIAVYVFTYSLSLAIWTVVLVLLVTPAAASTEARLLNRVLENSSLRQLGKISYSLYLSHVFVVYAIGYWLSNHYEWPEQWLFASTLAACSLVVCIALAQVLYLSIENPFIRVGRSIGVKKVPPSGQVSVIR